MVVAIDGPSGVGKSSVTRRVAAALGVPFFDTGAVYRAATLAVLRAGVDPDDIDAVVGVVEEAEFGYRNGTIFLDGACVSNEVRSPDVTAAVSAVSAIPQVRQICVAMQRAWVGAHGGAAVVEGRDIGTVVCPDAAVKIFLTAPPEVRAARRAGDPEAEGAAVHDVAADLQRRDRHDSTREASPLRPADDAVVIDTAALDLDAVVAKVLSLMPGGAIEPAP